MLKTYVCNYEIDGKRYTDTVQARSPMEAQRIINGKLANMGKRISIFQWKEIR